MKKILVALTILVSITIGAAKCKGSSTEFGFIISWAPDRTSCTITQVRTYTKEMQKGFLRETNVKLLGNYEFTLEPVMIPLIKDDTFKRVMFVTDNNGSAFFSFNEQNIADLAPRYTLIYDSLGKTIQVNIDISSWLYKKLTEPYEDMVVDSIVAVNRRIRPIFEGTSILDLINKRIKQITEDSALSSADVLYNKGQYAEAYNSYLGVYNKTRSSRVKYRVWNCLLKFADRSYTNGRYNESIEYCLRVNSMLNRGYRNPDDKNFCWVESEDALTPITTYKQELKRIASALRGKVNSSAINSMDAAIFIFEPKPFNKLMKGEGGYYKVLLEIIQCLGNNEFLARMPNIQIVHLEFSQNLNLQLYDGSVGEFFITPRGSYQYIDVNSAKRTVQSFKVIYALKRS